MPAPCGSAALANRNFLAIGYHPHSEEFLAAHLLQATAATLKRGAALTCLRRQKHNLLVRFEQGFVGSASSILATRTTAGSIVQSEGCRSPKPKISVRVAVGLLIGSVAQQGERRIEAPEEKVRVLPDSPV